MSERPPFFVFVHLPKTGGTSVRRAATAYFGKKRMLYDYGPEGRSSPPVQTWMKDKQDPAGFARAIEGAPYRFLSGHFHHDRYADVLPDAVFVTWMRQPCQRVWSAYRHYQRHGRFDGSFEAFYSRPAYQNEQSRALTRGLDGFDVVGVLEHHHRALETLNRRYNLGLEVRQANRAAGKTGSVSPDLPTPEDWARVADLNREDMDLYRQALKRYK